MKKENIIVDKTFAFAIRVVRLAQYLKKEHQEFDMSKQILRSGTSIGANVEEATGGQSKRDFIAKMHISYKEARETRYWIRLLAATDYLDVKLSDSLLSDIDEIIRLLNAILQSTKENLDKK